MGEENKKPIVPIEEEQNMVGWSKSDLQNFVQKFVQNSRVGIRDLNRNVAPNVTYSKYTKEQIVQYLSNPANNEKNLRDMSRYLYNTSCQYSRLIQYFANMLTFSYIITPVGQDPAKVEPDKFRAQYEKIKNKIQNMNLRHEFGKVLSIAFRDDVFYGYTYETKDSFMIQNLDPAYCKIDTIEDGVYQFSWDCSYFNSKEGLLEFYAEEFQTAYRAYRDNGGARWVQLNPKRSICIKVNEDTIDPIPPFVSLFSALADIEDYKAITKNASESSNYKAIALKIPVDDDGHLAMPRELVDTFYELLLEILPENIGAFTTPMDVKELTFEKSGALSETDAVSEAEDQFWRQAGVNSLIFGAGDDPSSSALAMSIHADEAICFRVLRQIERWVNRQLKYVSGSYKFAVKFLDVTVYNWQDVSNSLTKLGQYGMPVRSALASVSQMDPPTYENMLYLENEALRLYEHEIPLQSSNTISGEVGHPTNESKGLPLSDNGEESAENE